MRAVQLVGAQQVELRDVDEPDVGPGDVLLRVTGAGVCHSDLHLRHIGHQFLALPMTLGHEIAGTVAAVGPGVDGWENGQSALVYLCWGCGACRACAAGADNACERYARATVPAPGIGLPGGMAELVCVPARHLFALAGLDPVAAAPLADAALTTYHAISLARARLTPGSTALVIGVGGLGHLAVQILRATSAATIVAIDTDEARLRAAVELGADTTLPSDAQAAEEVLRLTGGRGADVVFDVVGIQQTLELATGCIANRGQLMLVGLGGGQLTVPADVPPVGLPWGASVIKPYAGTRADLDEVLALARAGRIAAHVEPFALDDAPEVLDRLEAGAITGRAVLVP
jgi:alcohol dehydrogenase, propanol-preferring